MREPSGSLPGERGPCDMGWSHEMHGENCGGQRAVPSPRQSSAARWGKAGREGEKQREGKEKKSK